MQDQPIPPLAENWLAGQGADRGRLRQLAADVFLPLGDAESTRIETLLRESGPRFEIVDSLSTRTGDHFETYTIAADRNPPDPSKPVALFVSFRTGEATSRLRGATFTSREAATEWMRGVTPPPTPAQARAEAARLDSRPDGTPPSSPDAAPARAKEVRRRHHRH
ncbi:hypothetical protein GCM10009759_17610 [Kitasatospora saccharophila]|uniref:Uncharacterized protein n=1 Tax=Kitasatospora saccharophila TaxID=407973 RepID=A0ABN2WGZ4_9ACTN